MISRLNADNLNPLHLCMYALTFLLMVVGVVQAISAAVEARDAVSKPESAPTFPGRPTGKGLPSP
ncbi:hypothetical protein [Ensifer sp. LCM 4579]|uniref:hypothetical protein n=1 Tax=Ensifer sp. LCM 4579 TaxID=1848292 RepID=UPI0008D8E4FA|nr:hypothetical protein [Ensifer sp. LCM 4579]OHV80379.1 hypothetical protein LCM4579_22605 [Ensifer sp. LCM 4579]